MPARAAKFQLWPPLLLAALSILACNSPLTFIDSMYNGDTSNDPSLARGTHAAETLEAVHLATLDAQIDLEIKLTATAEALGVVPQPAATATATETSTPQPDRLIKAQGVREQFYDAFGDQGNPVIKMCSTPVEIDLTLYGDGTAYVISNGPGFFDFNDNCKVLETTRVGYEGQGRWDAEGQIAIVTITNSLAHGAAPGEGSIAVHSNDTLSGEYRCYDVNHKLSATIKLGP